jgi:hypothetical protein
VHSEEGNFDQLTIKFCLKYWTQQNYQKKGNPKSTLRAESRQFPPSSLCLDVVADESRGVGALLAKAKEPLSHSGAQSLKFRGLRPPHPVGASLKCSYFRDS